MSPLRSLLVFAGVFFSRTYGYVDFGSLTLPVEPVYEPTPRPEQLPVDYDLRYQILPSMITAVAPSVTLVGNGTHETLYSLHYHHYFHKTRQGRGKFDKRGVFSGDPPVATCTPCGGDSAPTVTSSTSAVSCTTHHYHGVFDLPPSSTSAACYNTNYTGVFQPSTSAYPTLPCCFTIPASCRLNSTSTPFPNASTTFFSATTGVFGPTSSSMTTSLNATSTTSRFYLSTPTSTGGSSMSSSGGSAISQSDGAILNSGTISTSASTSASTNITSSSVSSTPQTTVIVVNGTTTVITLTTSTLTTTGSFSSSSSSASYVSNNAYTSPLSSVMVSTTSYSIIVISSTTITLTPSGTPTTTSGDGGVLDNPTLTIITGSTTPFTSTSVSLITSIKSNTIVGCGVASGSGIIDGTGTVHLVDGSSLTATASASGYASYVSGCGTIVATIGSFSGTASITGCGFGYGTGTLTGEGTVWPWYGGGLLSFVSSGTVSGAGSFIGCGTITGSGIFSATAGSPVLITPTQGPTKTVSVYLSYCPDPTGDANALLSLLSSNGTSAAILNLNDTSPLGYTSPYSSLPSNSTLPSNTTLPNAICQECPNSVGVCCPPTVSCDVSDGKCPQFAIVNAGNTINGYLIQQVMNSTAPVAGKKKVRALARKRSDEMSLLMTAE
ncbi:hypothetical protein H2200_002502 [Cladophialophora chaetospira]|uniref:Uncharacterized protein n=1 Tax=Cladophialophora chaetospira TaxID=386627 RepID=A0AA38XJX8_9EURO|nr:hypothetical protein H2200_002502 [Cladophialophora chaetospira]